MHDDRDMGRETAQEGRFGYASRHLLIGLDAAREGHASYELLRGRSAQVQVRTVLQHAWAEFEHDIRYKGTIPDEHVRDFDRRFTLAAGLLELADQEFSTIRDTLRASASSSDRCRLRRRRPADRPARAGGVPGRAVRRRRLVAHRPLRLDLRTAARARHRQPRRARRRCSASGDEDLIRDRMGYHYPPGAVRRLDDALLSAYGVDVRRTAGQRPPPSRPRGAAGEAHRLTRQSARRRGRGHGEGCRPVSRDRPGCPAGSHATPARPAGGPDAAVEDDGVHLEPRRPGRRGTAPSPIPWSCSAVDRPDEHVDRAALVVRGARACARSTPHPARTRRRVGGRRRGRGRAVPSSARAVRPERSSRSDSSSSAPPCVHVNAWRALPVRAAATRRGLARRTVERVGHGLGRGGQAIAGDAPLAPTTAAADSASSVLSSTSGRPTVTSQSGVPGSRPRIAATTRSDADQEPGRATPATTAAIAAPRSWVRSIGSVSGHQAAKAAARAAIATPAPSVPLKQTHRRSPP